MEINAKEKTALASSVGADEGQSDRTLTDNSIPENEENYNDNFQRLQEMHRRMQRALDPQFLHTISMTELYQTAYQGRRSIIDGLLYSGAYILAGAPKIGKSFLVAQFAYHVSTGQNLWNYTVRQGTVLYLALEDDYRRLQSRMYRMFGVESNEQLHFAIYAKQLGSGLDEQLQQFVKEHPNTKLIIIDTLQKIRETQGEKYSYANDYELIGRLKRFAEKYGVCILVVHHTRKQQADDKFDRISGTNGLLGAADGALILEKEKRTSGSAVLDLSSRDAQDQRLYLMRDEERLVWNLERTETELWKEPPDPILEAIVQLLKNQGEWQGSATELIDALGVEVQPNALTKKLNVQAAKLRNDFSIQYENSHSRSGSRITLRCIPCDV